MEGRTLMTAEAVAKLLASVKYILLDVDGVVWSGQHVLPNIPQTLQYLRSIGKEIRFLTNNASVSRAGLVRRFMQRGIEGVREVEVYNSGFVAALQLQRLLSCGRGSNSQQHLVERNVFVIGEEGLHEELQHVLARGFITYGLELHDAAKCGGYDPNVVATSWTQRTLPAPYQQPLVRGGTAEYKEGVSLADLSPGAVIVGLDMHFNMLKLAYASLCLQGGSHPNNQSDAVQHTRVPFIATNEDPQIPIGEDGVLLPGAGAMVRALCTVSGRCPDVVCGKPHVDMAKILFEVEGITDPRQCLMVGDRLTTDIAFGNAAGCRTMFVLSGAETLDDVAQAERDGNTSLLPEFIAPSLSTLMS